MNIKKKKIKILCHFWLVGAAPLTGFMKLQLTILNQWV